MKDFTFATIEIGSNNTKTHVYRGESAIYENSATIEFKKNYAAEKKVDAEDLEKLDKVFCTRWGVGRLC